MKATAYFLQATLILLWWLGLAINNSFFEAFQFPNLGAQAFNSFFAPDVIVIAILSLIRSYKNLRELEFVILGGFAYGAFYCINATILTEGGYLATVLMTLGLFYNLFLVLQNDIFRESASKSPVINGLKTMVQITCVWGITLVFFPGLILKAFGESLTPKEGPLFFIGTTILIIFSILGLISAFAMVKFGKGTPLPIDQPTELVSNGPYRYVRNPMAIAGVGQGIAVSLIYYSIPILIYTILGAALWQLVVRPIEEKNMSKRFGEEYDNYQRNVPCWLPRINYNGS